MVPWFTSGFQIKQGMQQNIILIPTSKLSFKVQFFAETYFRIFKAFAKIAKIRFSRKFLVIRYDVKENHRLIRSCYHDLTFVPQKLQSCSYRSKVGLGLVFFFFFFVLSVYLQCTEDYIPRYFAFIIYINW